MYRKKQNKMIRWIVAIALVMAAVIALIQHTSNMSSQPSMTTSPTVAPTVLPSVAPTTAPLDNKLIKMYYRAMKSMASDRMVNSDVKYIGFDFTKLSNLNEDEKTALISMMKEKYHKKILTGDYDSLCERGYIDGDNLCWDDGVLYTISTNNVSDDKFTFSVSQWYSGTGATGMDNCEATRSADGKWSYTEGGFWIS